MYGSVYANVYQSWTVYGSAYGNVHRSLSVYGSVSVRFLVFRNERVSVVIVLQREQKQVLEVIDIVSLDDYRLPFSPLAVGCL
jgi:hypothetical protein